MVSPVSYTWTQATVLIDNGWGERGTGFWMSRELDDQYLKMFLVTNKHVLYDGASARSSVTDVELHVNVRRGSEVAGEAIQYPLYAGSGESLVREHPDANVDVLAIDVTNLFIARQDIYFKSAYYSLIALGLKWSDIDLDAGTLRVNRQLQRVRRDGDRSGSLVFSEPKNSSRRAMGLPPRAVRALREHRKRQLEDKLRASSEWQDNGLVFSNSKGKLLEAQNVVNRSFKPLLERAGLPPIRFHDLRHSCLSLLAQRGEPIRDLQALAGHATTAFTLQRYTHHYDESARRTADAMGDILPDEPYSGLHCY